MTSDIVNARILELEDQVADNNDRAERYRMWFKAAIHQLRELAFQTDYQQNNHHPKEPDDPGAACGSGSLKESSSDTTLTTGIRT